jgi:hypothetical protein
MRVVQDAAEIDPEMADQCAVNETQTVGMYLVIAARGWSTDQWERLVVDTLAHALLR